MNSLDKRKAYERPVLVKHGTVGQLTLGSISGPDFDNSFTGDTQIPTDALGRPLIAS